MILLLSSKSGMKSVVYTAMQSTVKLFTVGLLLFLLIAARVYLAVFS